MNKLISHYFPNNNRKSISFSFEILRDNLIKVNKTFFNNEEVSEFFKSQKNEKNSIDIKESHLILEFNELQNLLIQLSKETNLCELICESLIFSDNINISEWVDSLNEKFTGINYSIINKKFIIEDFVDNIRNLLRYSIEPFTNSSLEDYLETTRPEIKEIEDYDKKLYELRVYNVGQANCSALIKYTSNSKENYKVLIVFDFGCDGAHSRNKSLLDMINHIDKDTFILISHFHYDHYNNIAANLLLKTRKWIFPNCISKSTKANRLFHVLLKVASTKTSSGTIYYLPSPFNLSKNISFHQYNGVAMTTPIKNSLINNQSIVSIVEIGETKVLIPADATYEVYSSDITSNKYDYILIPHHGCYYPPSSYVSAVVNAKTFGIVQSGFNYYGHPDINHLSQYKRNVFMHNTLIYDRKSICGKDSSSKIDYYPICF